MNYNCRVKATAVATFNPVCTWKDWRKTRKQLNQHSRCFGRDLSQEYPKSRKTWFSLLLYKVIYRILTFGCRRINEQENKRLYAIITFFSRYFFHISACRQMEFGIQAIFGPSDPLLGAHIQSICEALDIPHVETRIDFEPTFKEFSINLHPSQEHMNHAFKDVMTFLNWTKVAIIYEEDYGKTYSSSDHS